MKVIFNKTIYKVKHLLFIRGDEVHFIAARGTIHIYDIDRKKDFGIVNTTHNFNIIVTMCNRTFYLDPENANVGYYEWTNNKTMLGFLTENFGYVFYIK